MVELDPTKGNLIGFLNLKKGPDDKRPTVTGKLSLPGNPVERGFSLWAYASKTDGQTLLSGKAGFSPTTQIDQRAKAADPLDFSVMEKPAEASIQLGQNGEKPLTIDPHSMVLFKNKQKDQANPDRPDYYGYYNPGAGETLMKLSVWAKNDRHGNAMLTGNVQRDEPKKEKVLDKDQSEEREQRPEPERKKKKSMAM